jgi:cell division protein FtsQ
VTVIESAQRFTTPTHRRSWLRVGAVVLAVVLVTVAVWVVWFSSLLTAREVRVLGAVDVSVDAVRQAAAVTPGTPLARIDVDGIVERVGAIPEVGAVEVRRGWPDVLVLVVTERTPVVIAKASGTPGYVYVDAGGARFGAVGVRPRQLPLMRAYGDDARASALAVVTSLPPDIERRVTDVTARTRDDVVLTLRSGAQVRWGSAERAERKAEVLRALLPVRAEVYDVSAPDLPTTTGTPG